MDVPIVGFRLIASAAKKIKCLSSKDPKIYCFICKFRFLVYLIVNLLTKLYFLRSCECKHKPTDSDLKEAVAKTQQIVNETQRMIKVGSKWLKALYNAHLEENHDFKEKDAEEKDGDWNNWDD